MRFVPTRIHGVLDYVGSLFLIFCPTIFMYNELSGAAVIMPIAVGASMLASSLTTRYEFGIVHLLPFSLHLAIDFLASAFLILSPFLFQYASDPLIDWLPTLIVGIMLLIGVFVSKTRPQSPGTTNTTERL